MFDQAWAYNPLGYLIYFILIILILRPLITRIAPGMDKLFQSWLYLHALPIGTAVIFLLFGLWRIFRIMFLSV